VFRLDVSEPSLNASEKVRLIAMRASQRSGVAWEIGKALRVQVDISFDLVSGRRAYKSQYGHHYLLISGWELARAAERPHSGSPRQKLQDEVGQDQQSPNSAMPAAQPCRGIVRLRGTQSNHCEILQ
jgi:hypothetical protein